MKEVTEMEKRFVGVKELALYLGIKEATVYAWVSCRRFPYFKVGSLVKFDLKEIELCIARMRVEPLREVCL